MFFDMNNVTNVILVSLSGSSWEYTLHGCHLLSRIRGVMVSTFSSCVVDFVFESLSGRTKD